MGVWLFSVIGLLLLSDSNAFLLSRDLPCKYLDSINITDGIRQHDDSILYNGITFPKDQYTKVNYKLEKGEERVFVEPYIRGCVCNKKPCIRLCCPIGMFFDATIIGSQKCQPHSAAKGFTADLIDEQNKTEKITLDDHFAFVNDRPCNRVYLASNYNVTITQRGFIFFENNTIPHQKYCLKASLNKETNISTLDLAMCFTNQDKLETRYTILPYGMLLSVPFILATILVYICLPELRNLHGKCLLCYLIGLIIGYTAMALVQLNGMNYVEPLICKSVGYLIYFSFLSAFLWLSVISFDLWWNFRTTSGFLVFSEKMRFTLYMIYAWGLSSLLTFTVFILDSMPSISESIRPGIGVGTCFLKKTVASQFVFFYMPLCIICTINIIFFLLTALKIRKVQQDLKKITSHEESSRHQSKFNHDKDNFTLYLRLFIVMGVTWSMEGISFLISENSDFFLLTDICNTIQGVLIFVLFVLKRRVVRLIKKRWQGCFGKATTSGSVATNSTSATYAPSNIVLNQISCPNEKSKGTC
ncbi:G-protein coupled receptor Mth2-like [Contarinia nasturtii]|uniref:G-protein coupled receptor Mth2-like n=1 Tax=Contarinia nasturtii TaxID=265458 RepID=UPI0012D4C1D1|nr:G-protein coupled receptor Mth2-like [Contarinia nasturtii]XP_031622143.1 G-protein coupled receptor Mth2-like [Contarinia nasturtii]XP_031622144.1 G-protein coupled receptor Mth2-like [Contarinia nasturtii]XP_031622145.1 G-protein coupled receptor Mth2-like [Contarinia nasturtii]XP_031622146.1 G-protein coupled receptor Mth2-like [Contarinia nasturtii]XP_031622147.1 G-protein coupled receptor Mth2-like [Contarinia nasturtii]